MSTRTVTVSAEERGLLLNLLTTALHDAEDDRMRTRPDSPMEAAADIRKNRIAALIHKVGEA